jgi:hypothetical protein
MEKLYWFYVIDGRNGRDQEAEQMLQKFMIKGHKIENLYIFTSTSSIDEIHSFIKENKLKDFMYLLTDMTNNISDNSFKTILNETYFRSAEKLYSLFKGFKSDKKTEITQDSVNYQEQLDKILDQILEKGKDSLQPEQKQFLEKYNKTHPKPLDSSGSSQE